MTAVDFHKVNSTRSSENFHFPLQKQAYARLQSWLLLGIYCLAILLSAATPQTAQADGTAAPAAYTTPTPSSRTSNGLEIRPITAYNLIVDSNVLSPSSYGPSAATIGAQFCNTGGTALTNVWAYTGSFDPATNAGIPGIYPQRVPSGATFTAEHPTLVGATQTDYGGPIFSLKHEGGSLGSTADASRYIGTLAAGACRTEYWLVSYPRKALVGSSWVSVTGGIKPQDDLWLSYYLWAKSNETGANASFNWRPVTMRNEISAMANKIWPNGDNKVPDQYKAAIASVVGWDTITPGGASIVYPGQTVTSQGIWYDLGNVGAGFDNNYDFVPDRNAWVQPIGDAGTYNPGCFRLLRSYGIVIIKLNDGTEQLIPFVDHLYFENIPDNNNGAVGLVFYEYAALDGACTSGLTPYQEVASGYDNEKFNGDYGAGIPPLQSTQTNMTLTKTGTPSVAAGGTVTYNLTFSLPEAGSGATSYVSVGNPSLGLPLVYEDTVPSGMTYVANSASTTLTGAHLPVGIGLTRLFSKDSGATWSPTDPGTIASTGPNNLVEIQWWLDMPVTQQSYNGGAVTGTVSFQANAPTVTPPPTVTNTGCLKLGNGPCFTDSSAITLISGPYQLSGTVFCDDGSKYSASGVCSNTTNAGIYANGTHELTPAEPGMPAIKVELYYDPNNTGIPDPNYLIASQDTNASGGYSFGNLPAGYFIIKVIKSDPDVQTTYSLTTPETRKAQITTASISGLDFGFAPPLTVTKALETSGAINIGELFSYKLAIHNNLPGGSGTSNSCTYTIWASKENLDNSTYSQPPAGGSGNARFQEDPANPNAVTGSPDGINAYTNLSNSDNVIGLKGFNVDPATLPGTITKVESLVKVSERLNLKSDAQVLVTTYYNGNGTGTTLATSYGSNIAGTPLTGSGYFTGSTGTSYEVVTDVTALKSWTASDFTLDNAGLQVTVGKGTGSNSGGLNLDATAFKVTTNQPCPNTPDTTLDPAPLVDAFPTAYMDFVSADPPPSAVNEAGGMLTWNNLGPIPAGSSKEVTVTFRATAQATSQVNTATSTGGKFANGLNANSDSATAQVTISNVVASGQISGEIFDDNAPINGWHFNGTCTAGTLATCPLDAVDTPIQGVRVNLMACVRLDGTFETSTGNKTCTSMTADNTWQVWQTTYTDSAGKYQFTDLRPGFYRVMVDTTMLPGSTQKADPNEAGICTTCDSTSNGDVNFTIANWTLGQITGNTIITNLNFGYDAPSTLYSIGDEVFYDWNGNGVRDAGDEIIPGVTLKLLDAGGTQLATSSTNPALVNPYSFTRVNGVYTVKVDSSTLPAIPLTQTGDPDQASTTCSTCDGQSTFTLNGANNWTRDFGYQPYGTASIGDTVFKDINGNGLQDGTAEAGLPNITVWLKVDMDGNGTWFNARITTTDANGNYLFSNLPDGTYHVAVDTADSDITKDAFGYYYVPSNGAQYSVVVSGGTVTSMTNAAGTTSTTANGFGDAVENDPLYLDADFGFYPLGAFGDTVYWDVNGNGTQDFVEDGVPGVTVNLYTFTDSPSGPNHNNRYDPGETISGTPYATKPTDASGKYLFTGLPPNTYVAEVVTTSGPLAGYKLTGDPDKDGVPCPTGVDTLCDNRSGMRIYPGTNFMGADFGYQPRGVIGDTLWIDSNNNHVLDLGEVGLANVTITLTGGSCSPACVVDTDADGHYLFGNLSDGTYSLTIDTAGLPAGLVNSYDPGGTPNNAATITIAGGVVAVLDGSACTSCDLNTDFGYRYIGGGQLSGTVCLDSLAADSNGANESFAVDPSDQIGICGDNAADPSGTGSGEVGYDNVVAHLYRWVDTGNGLVEPAELTTVATSTTDANGDFSFTNIPDGAYYVVSINAPQDGLELTTQTGDSPTVGNDVKEQVVENNPTGPDTAAYQAVWVPAATSVPNVDFAFTSSSHYDFGDLPVSYSTLLESNPDGARNLVPAIPTLYLGNNPPDYEENGIPTTDASGDGADEDGVSVNPTDINWSDGSGSVTVTVHGSGYLGGWIDFNKDGDFTDTGEMVIDQNVTTGANQVFPFTVPAGTFTGNRTALDARFRLFPSAPAIPSLAFAGAVDGGEVEDYQFVWDMQIDKDVNTHTAAPGGQVMYEIYVHNNGNQPLSGIQVTDTLPTGFTLVSTTLPGGVTCTGTTSISCGPLSLAAGASQALDLYVTVSSTAGTYSNDATATAAEGVTVTDLGAVSDNDTLNDIGATETDPATDEDVTIQTIATIGDLVWNDLNHNGMQDAGEPGLDNVTINLLDSAGTNILQTTTTDASGAYSFTTTAGTYIVEFVAPGGYAFSATGQGTGATDSDASVNGRTPVITVTPGQTDTNWDAGLYQPATIGDFVWDDQGHDGVQDPGEPGLNNVTVNLWDSAGATKLQTTTTTGGAYSFTVPSGTYIVEFVAPAGYVFTTTGQGTTSTDSNANPATGRTATITVSAGQTDLTWDAGLYQPPAAATIGDFVWDDQDHNGVQDPGELGLNNVTVNLWDSAGTSKLQTTTTINGAYSFTVPSGTYILEFVAPGGYAFSVTGQGTSTTDNDATVNGRTTAITVSAGQTDNTWDAGLYQPATIGDFVWDDFNHNGVQDAGELGLANVTVRLLDSTGTTILQTSKTNGSGAYSFTVTSGTYVVEFVTPAGYVFTTTGQGTGETDNNAAANGRTGSITVTPGQADDTWDAGLYQPATIGDLVWNDLNHNGIQDGGESGIVNVTVNLLDSTGTAVLQTTTTDGSGAYSFNTPSGTYIIEFVTPSGYVFTLTGQGTIATDNNANAAGRTGGITVTPGQTDTSWDAGLYQPATIGDFVWNDLNHDGIQDAGELGLANVTVNLLDSTGTIVLQTTTTDGSGAYSFILPSGTYVVEFVAPGGYVFTLTGQGTSAADNNAAANGRTGTVTVTPGQTDTTWDGGLYQPATIGNFVWDDVNHNGIQDVGEPGLGNVTVNLLDSTRTTVLQTTTTNASGIYSFSVPSGMYVVEFVAPGGYTFTKTGLGTATTDSNANPLDGQTTAISVTPGQTDMNWDAGLYQPATIGDFVWNDLNHNGVQDASELGLANVTVRLLDSSGTTVLQTTATNASGLYSFTVPSGAYVVEFVAPAGYAFTQAGQGTSTTDSNANPANGRTTVITVTPNQADDSWDAGLYQPATIGNLVWNDLDHNGIQDAGELGVANITINLRDSSGTTILQTTTTNGSGAYSFTVPSGTYIEEFVAPGGYIFTLTGQGTASTDSNANPADGRTTAITVTPGQADDTWDAGLYQPPAMATIGDFVWDDVNHNGVQDAGETGLANVSVTLLDSTGTTVLQTTTTDASGIYSFAVPSGTYMVEFLAPGGFVFTQAGQGTVSTDSNANPVDGRTVAIPVTPGQMDTTWDAGLYQPATIGDYVWNDFNHNGVQDPGEPALANVTVRLLDSTGTTVLKTTTTNVSGIYSFTVPTGTYVIEFVAPGGYTFTATGQGTAATDSNANPANGRTTIITISPAQTDLTWDAGVYQPATIGDFVWNDLNHNGIQDAGELGLANVTVRLLDSTGTTTLQTITTNASGIYSFAVPSGTYIVEFVAPAGYLFTATGQGTAATDSNANPADGRTVTIAVSAGQTDTNWDAGLYQPATIGDFVWDDQDHDGVQDPGELGLNNVTLNLWDSAGTTKLQTTTTTGGAYSFTVPSGTYVVEFVAPAWYLFTQTGQGSVTSDSNANPATGRTATITVTPGQTDNTWDAGLYQATDLSITKTTDLADQMFYAGDQFTYTLTITNNGLITAHSVTVADDLPQEVSFISSNPVATSGPAPYQWSLGDILAGQVKVITILVKINPTVTTSFTNTATVSTPDGETVTTNNLDDVTVDPNDPTPVELVYFRAVRVGDDLATVQWATETEVDTFGYRLVRANVNDISKAAQVYFAPVDPVTKTYQFIDAVPTSGVYWYWLIKIDTKGMEEASDPIEVFVYISDSVHQIFIPIVTRK